MKIADQLIDRFLEGELPSDLINSLSETLEEAQARTAARPRLRRFRGRKGVNPLTGKRVSAQRSRIAKVAARKGKSKRKAAMKKFARSAMGKQFYKKLGKLSGRVRK